MTATSSPLSLEEIVDGAAWETLRTLQPDLARDIALLVRRGESPAKIAAFARRKGATPLFLSLVESAAAHMAAALSGQQRLR
jgi:hypothetical protein